MTQNQRSFVGPRAPLRAAVALLIVVAVACWAAAGCGGGGGGSGSGGQSAGGGGGGGSTTPPPSSGQTAFDTFRALLAAIPSLPAADQQQRLSAFIAAQKDTLEGFPLRSGRAAIFVYHGPSAGPLAVAGEWNGWSTGALPLARVGATDVWTAQATLPAAARYEYKLVERGATWLPDPLNRKFTYDFENSILNLAGSGRSHLERLAAVHATRLGNDRDVTVYVPEGGLDSAERYPVLYMHDGQNIFDPGAFYGGWDVDGTCDALIASGAIKKIIVVGMANTPGRFDEYTHVPDDISNSCSGQIVGGRAADYADFIVNDVKPRIDALYPTRPGREDTAVLGSSLGGLVSLWIAFAYPNVFANAGGMSSTLEWGRFCALNHPRIYEIAQQRGKIPVRFYLDSGGVGAQQPSSDSWGATEELKLLFEQQGYQHGVDLFHWWTPGATHDEAAWRARMDMPLKFWFHP